MITLDFLDVHTHLLGKKIFRQLDIVRTKWIQNNVIQVVQVSETLHESKKAVEIFKDYPEVVIGVGKHPWKAKNVNEEEKGEFEKLIAKNEVKVIGEIGLDYYAVKDESRYEYQRNWFEFFIAMSNTYKKPLNIHVTGAERDIYNLLDTYWDRVSAINIHWYSGPVDTLQKLIELGCYFSINPAIHYSKGHQNALSVIPLSRIMTESDGDVFYKPLNQLGEPSIVLQVVDKICELKNYKKDELVENIGLNYRKYMQNIIP